MARQMVGKLVFIPMLLAGCSVFDRYDFSDRRPPIRPAPADVQSEIRDARFFLPYPDESIGPSAELHPSSARYARSSR